LKSPILNEVSLYVHLKLGFSFMGTYKGDYPGTKDEKFENYQSIGLIHLKNSYSIKKRDDILKAIKEII
jgi:hypothetical protein